MIFGSARDFPEAVFFVAGLYLAALDERSEEVDRLGREPSGRISLAFAFAIACARIPALASFAARRWLVYLEVDFDMVFGFLF